MRISMLFVLFVGFVLACPCIQPTASMVYGGTAAVLVGYFGTLFLLRRSKQTKQTTFCYCSCGNELCGSDSFLQDYYDEHGRNHVMYSCSACGELSDFDFEFPVPVKRKANAT